MAVIFDTTIVSVALHTLSVQLDAPVSTVQWVTTGYLLALGIAVPLSTWAQRRFGSKRLWMAALAVFLIGSVGSSLAWNVDALIAWRVVQGAGGGIMFPLLTTLIMQAAGGKAPRPSPSPSRARTPARGCSRSGWSSAASASAPSPSP
jgi:MFS family permease